MGATLPESRRAVTESLRAALPEGLSVETLLDIPEDTLRQVIRKTGYNDHHWWGRLRFAMRFSLSPEELNQALFRGKETR